MRRTVRFSLLVADALPMEQPLPPNAQAKLPGPLDGLKTSGTVMRPRGPGRVQRLGRPILLALVECRIPDLGPFWVGLDPRKNASNAASMSKSSHSCHSTNFGLWTRNRPELAGVYGTATAALAQGKP